MVETSVLELARFLKERIPGLRFPRKNLQIHQETIRDDAKHVDVFLRHLNETDQVEAYRRFGLEVAFLSRVGLKPLCDELKNILKADAKSPTVVSPLVAVDWAEPYSPGFDVPVGNLVLVVSAEDDNHAYVYCVETERFKKHTRKFAVSAIRRAIGDKDEAERFLAERTIDVDFVYDPFSDGKKLRKTDHGYTFNTYTGADWPEGWTPPSDPVKPPELWAEFMGIFVPDEPCRRATEAWLRDAVFTRADPILVLCGIPGVGKNIFIQIFARALVAKHNFALASPRFREGFNSQIANCRVFYMDEVALDPKLREQLKAYHNSTAAIEKKGKDAETIENIWASFAVSNNNLTNIKLEYNDRKFFAPDLGTKNLDAYWPKSKQAAFVALADDRDYLRELAGYLYSYYPEGASRSYPKTEILKRIAFAQYPVWFRHLYDVCHEAEIVREREFNRKLGLGRKTGITDIYKIEELVKHFRATFETSLGEVLKDDDNHWVVRSALVGRDPIVRHEVYREPESENLKI